MYRNVHKKSYIPNQENMKKNIKSFAESINIEFKDLGLLETALTHRSYINEYAGSGRTHNERLEFLGDAVLEIIVTDHLFHKYPDKPEGDLTAFRSAVVNTNSISEAASKLNVNEYLLLSKGEAKDTGRAREYILANAFEAIIGAIYLDQGYEVATRFISENLFYKIDDIVENKSWKDAKSLVQEKAQEIFGETPSYEVLSESGPDHDKEFIVGIYFGKNLIAKGKGKSKQSAEQEAAQEAVKKKKWS